MQHEYHRYAKVLNLRVTSLNSLCGISSNATDNLEMTRVAMIIALNSLCGISSNATLSSSASAETTDFMVPLNSLCGISSNATLAEELLTTGEAYIALNSLCGISSNATVS